MATDKWLDWIVNRRFGGNKQHAESMKNLFEVRDKIIAGASIKEGDVVLDIGAGDGLVGFAALTLVGSKGRVIFSDISENCVNACKEIYASMESPNPAEFIATKAQELSQLENNSIDVIVFRSVLIYISEKLDCFKEFYRVLKPGGKISFFEPINIFTNRHKMKNTVYGIDITPIAELWKKVANARKPLDLENDPMLNFDEEDLFSLVREAGFESIDMNYNAYLRIGMKFPSWDYFFKSAPNPNALSMEEEVEKALSPEEKETFIAYMKPKIENEKTKDIFALIYLTAMRELNY